jgi:hypothetical protein
MPIIPDTWEAEGREEAHKVKDRLVNIVRTLL